MAPAGSGRGRGRGRVQSREVTVSKALSFLLRHGAREEGVPIDEGGWVRVVDVLEWRRLASLHVTFDEISRIVKDNDKQRFSLESLPTTSLAASKSPNAPLDPSAHRIRASQGHSVAGIASSNIYERLDPAAPDCPSLVVHGTYPRSWEEIKKFGGLKPMSRTHIHFATELPRELPPLDTKYQKRSKPQSDKKDDGVVSGMRKDATVLVWVDVKRSASEGGVQWWRSRNGVILTDGVEKVVGGGEMTKTERSLELRWVRWVEIRQPEGGGEVIWGTRPEGWRQELRRGINVLEQGLKGLSVEDKPVVMDVEESRRLKSNKDQTGAGVEVGEKLGPLKDNWDD